MSTPPIDRNVIRKFDREHRFLSNFYATRVMLDGEWYPSVEHAYQAAKTTNALKRYQISQMLGADAAKRMGRRIHTLRPNWDNIKVEIMRDLLMQKFALGTEFATRLLDTGETPLIEGNLWGDTFWGVCDGVGENMLGRLLMEVRESLKETV